MDAEIRNLMDEFKRGFFRVDRAALEIVAHRAQVGVGRGLRVEDHLEVRRVDLLEILEDAIAADLVPAAAAVRQAVARRVRGGGAAPEREREDGGRGRRDAHATAAYASAARAL